MLVTILGLILVVAASVFVAWPLLSPVPGGEPTGEDEEAVHLAGEKEATLEAIREADFDHRVGKISDADHAALRAELEERALQALSAADDGHPGDGASPGPRDTDGTVFCAGCGGRLDHAARFCMKCGTKRPRSAQRHPAPSPS